jgi:hypothetical protein
MKNIISKKAICIISIISIFSFTSCDALDDLSDSVDNSIDQSLSEILGVSVLTEEADKTSSNYNAISDIVISNKLFSTSEIKMTLPSSISISYTKKRYTLTGSMWTITNSSYSGIIAKSLFNRTSNVVKISVQNNNPTVYVNNVVASSANSGGTGGSGTTTGESSLMDVDVSGNAYQLKVVSFTVPTGVKTMVVKTNEPTNNYRNLADLYVRKSSAPIVAGPIPPTYLPKYTWTADYISQTPNREIKICTISNPSSGTWYAGLYGFNSDYTSRLTVTITK